MKIRIVEKCFFVAALLLLLPSAAVAQSGNSSLSTFSRTAGNFNVTNRINNRPTVSPYLRLLQNNGNPQSGLGGVQPVYQTQVRPMLQRREQQRQQQAQIQQIQQNLGQLRQQFTQPNRGFMQTGHPTRFMSYSHYYPALNFR